MIKRIFSSHTIQSTITAIICLLCDIMLYAWYESALSIFSLAYFITLFFSKHNISSLIVSALCLCMLSLVYYDAPFIPLSYIIPLLIARRLHVQRYLVHALPTYTLTLMLCLCIHTFAVHITTDHSVRKMGLSHLLGLGATSVATLALLTCIKSRKSHA